MDDSLDEVQGLDIFCTNSIQKGPMKKIYTNQIDRKNSSFFVS